MHVIQLTKERREEYYTGVQISKLTGIMRYIAKLHPNRQGMKGTKGVAV